MNSFVNAVQNQEARTDNGMKARKSTANAVVDLFYKIGASRGKDITADFVSALVQNEELALRVALWSRDVRGGAGEREFGHEGGEKVRGSGAGGGEPRFQRVFQGHQLVHLEQDPAFLGEG